VYARGAIPGHAGWPVTLSSPASPDLVLAQLDVSDYGLGGSGVKKGRHIVDPRTAAPVPGGRAAWVAAESAARADALSTACMVMTMDEVQALWSAHPEIRILFVETLEDGKEEVHRFGFAGGQDDTTRLSANNS
jgi:thiamine biosynthesis lipoprotein ApbE